MFKKIITFLYRKWCEPPHIKNLYLGGVQRDFGRILTEKEVSERNSLVYAFLQTGWFEQILMEELRGYVDGLFNTCETQKQRDFMHDSINILLKFEERMHRVGHEPNGNEEFDKYAL